MWHDSFKLFVKKIWKKFQKTKEMIKTEFNHDEVDGNIYKDKKYEWLDYVERVVSCTAFSYARFCKTLEEINGFSMKESLSAPGLSWKCFNSLRTEEDEPIYDLI